MPDVEPEDAPASAVSSSARAVSQDLDKFLKKLQSRLNTSDIGYEYQIIELDNAILRMDEHRLREFGFGDHELAGLRSVNTLDCLTAMASLTATFREHGEARSAQAESDEQRAPGASEELPSA